jgi:hypothetical protein
MLGALPGKKALVYLATAPQSLPAGQVEGLVNDAIRANVAFYTVDVGGR